MAKSENERGSTAVFKHRIVGAVVLVAVAVLVLPLILNSPAPVAQERASSSAASGKEGTKLFVSRITPAGESTRLEQVNKSVSGALPPAVTPSGSAATDSVPVIPAKSETKAADKPGTPAPGMAGGSAPSPDTSASNGAKVMQSKEPPAEKPKVTAATKPKEVAVDQKPVKVKSGWIVQAGVFAQTTNAERIAGRLKSAGYRPTVGPVRYGDKNYFRVFVGPYNSRDEAARTSEKVRQTLHEKVAVVAYP